MQFWKPILSISLHLAILLLKNYPQNPFYHHHIPGLALIEAFNLFHKFLSFLQPPLWVAVCPMMCSKQRQRLKTEPDCRKRFWTNLSFPCLVLWLLHFHKFLECFVNESLQAIFCLNLCHLWFFARRKVIKFIITFYFQIKFIVTFWFQITCLRKTFSSSDIKYWT